MHNKQSIFSNGDLDIGLSIVADMMPASRGPFYIIICLFCYHCPLGWHLVHYKKSARCPHKHSRAFFKTTWISSDLKLRSPLLQASESYKNKVCIHIFTLIVLLFFFFYSVVCKWYLHPAIVVVVVVVGYLLPALAHLFLGVEQFVKSLSIVVSCCIYTMVQYINVTVKMSNPGHFIYIFKNTFKIS